MPSAGRDCAFRGGQHEPARVFISVPMGAKRKSAGERPDRRDRDVDRIGDPAGDKAPQSSRRASDSTSRDLEIEARFRLGQALATRVSDVTHLTEAMAAKANLTELTSRRF